MDVGIGIIREEIFENQWILCRSELVPEKGFGEPFSLVALKVRKGSGVREEAFGGISVKIQD